MTATARAPRYDPRMRTPPLPMIVAALALTACARAAPSDSDTDVPFPFTGDTFVIVDGDTSGWDTAVPSLDLPEAPTWAEHIGPMFAEQCIPCHDPGESGGLSMVDPYARLVAPTDANGAPMPYVTPGDPARSCLWHKTLGTQLKVGGNGVRMPRGTTGMSIDERELIRRWITTGAH